MRCSVVYHSFWDDKNHRTNPPKEAKHRKEWKKTKFCWPPPLFCWRINWLDAINSRTTATIKFNDQTNDDYHWPHQNHFRLVLFCFLRIIRFPNLICLFCFLLVFLLPNGEMIYTYLYFFLVRPHLSLSAWFCTHFFVFKWTMEAQWHTKTAKRCQITFMCIRFHFISFHLAQLFLSFLLSFHFIPSRRIDTFRFDFTASVPVTMYDCI